MLSEGEASNGGHGDGRSEGSPGPVAPLDLMHLTTSEDVDGAVGRESGRGYLVNVVTGRTIAVEPYWITRAKRARRIHRAWLGQAWQQVQAGKAWLAYWGLTIRPEVQWHPRMISNLVQELRRRYRGSLLDDFWVGELQPGTGQPHYNLYLLMRRGVSLPKPDQAGLWPHGSTHTKAIKEHKDGLYGSGLYGSKLSQKGEPGGPQFPKGFRLYGMKLGKGLGRASRILVRLARLPAWIHDLAIVDGPQSDSVPIRCKSGGGWFWKGRRHFSPWRWQGVALHL